MLRGNVDEVFRAPDVEAAAANINAALDVHDEVVLVEEDSALAAFLAEAEDETDTESDGHATVADNSDQTVGSESLAFDTDESPKESFSDGDFLDPVPTDSEIAAVGIDDVELVDEFSGVTINEAEIDPAPLNVGDLLGDESENPSGPNDPRSNIHLFTGDGEFPPGAEGMKLQPDPMTGELHFPLDDEESDDSK